MTLSKHNKHKILNKITFKRTQSPEHGASNKTLLLLICSPSWEIQKLKLKDKNRHQILYLHIIDIIKDYY
jgi:hypothetical protein